MVRYEDCGELALDAKVEMIRSLVPLGLMHVHELLEDEVKALAGERCSRKDELERGRRHGSNPGTVGLGGQRVPIRVLRVRSIEGGEIPLRCYEAVSHGGEVNDLLLKRVLYGISCRNYEAAAEAIPGAIGLSSSTVSRGFVQASAAKLREMQERDLTGEDVVALFLELTLHRLGVHAVLGRSFKTTNCLESVNALVEERCAKVDHWKNSSQRQRWLATALVDIEPRLRKVVGYRHLPKLREALKRELKIEAKTSTVSKKKVA